MSPDADLPGRLYHLAVSDEWLDAVTHGAPYRRSTLGRSLEYEGFIHCSFANQVQRIADAVFRGRDDVVLLTIDPSRVEADIRVEAVDGAEECFPHIYGPLPLDAVTRTDGVPVGEDGALLVEEFLKSD
jgi:glutathione S-transferase